MAITSVGSHTDSEGRSADSGRRVTWGVAISPRLIVSDHAFRLGFMSPRRHPALAAFLALVMLCGQVFGLQRGFVCECGGFERVTALDHCHGMSEREEHELPAHDRDDHGDGDPVHEHPPLKMSQEAESSVVSAPVTPVAPTLVFLPWTILIAEGSLLEKTAAFHPPRAETGARPLWPPRLARTIALRI